MNENIEEFGAERQLELSVIEASGLFQRQIEIDCDPDHSSGEACRRCGSGRAVGWADSAWDNTRERQDG